MTETITVTAKYTNGASRVVTIEGTDVVIEGQRPIHLADFDKKIKKGQLYIPDNDEHEIVQEAITKRCGASPGNPSIG